MEKYAFSDFFTIDERNSDFRFFAERPLIRILFYTDHPSVSIDDDDAGYGVSRLKKLIDSHKPAFADVEISLVNRHQGEHGAHKLTTELLSNYDELWVFGMYQLNMDKLTLLHGGPQNELNDNEVDALQNWMTTGGVLMTGDHANINPRTNDPDHGSFLSLGKALGNRVPRAGELRGWQGIPTDFKEESFNTQVNTSGHDPDNLDLQQDGIPQSLELPGFGLLGLPHPIFLGRSGPIQAFPDHAHEGALTVSSLSNGATSSGWKPKPVTIAYGRDKRFPGLGRRYELVAAYDGDPASVGRIIADSTWHHYFNVNLSGFTDTTAGSDLDLIGQYYGNLTIWLAPRKLRRAMTRAMFWWIVNHPLMSEESVGNPSDLGETALKLLSKVASPCEIHEL